MVLEGSLRNIKSRRRSRVLISGGNTQVGKNYFDSDIIQEGIISTFPNDYFAADVDKNKYLHAKSLSELLCTHYVGNVIYYKFSHGDLSIGSMVEMLTSR